MAGGHNGVSVYERKRVENRFVPSRSVCLVILAVHFIASLDSFRMANVGSCFLVLFIVADDVVVDALWLLSFISLYCC